MSVISSVTTRLGRCVVMALIAVTTLATTAPSSVAHASSSGAALYQPDARIRLACAYTRDWQPCEADWVGDDVYNRDATNQRSRWTDYLTYSTERDPRVIVFRISIENDGSAADRFRVITDGVTSGYRVKFFRGTTNITAALEGGTYQTPLISSGGAFVIKAKVVMPCDSWDNCGQDRATRLVTVRSVADPSIRDAVKFVRRIWECTC